MLIDPRSETEASGTATGPDTGDYLDGTESHEEDLQTQHIEAVTADVHCNDSQKELSEKIGKCKFLLKSKSITQVRIRLHPKSTDTGADDMMLEEIDTRTMKADCVAEYRGPLRSPLQNDNQIRYVIDSSVIQNVFNFVKLNAYQEQDSPMPENISQEFTAQRAFGFTKTVVNEKSQLKVLTTQQPFGFTKTAIATGKSKLKVLTTEHPFGFTKTAVADTPKTKTLISPTITINNDVFDKNVDDLLSGIRKNT